MFRKRISAALLCCLIGVGLIIVGSGRTQDVIVPGPLSSPHAERLTHFGNDRCASCHPQAHQSVGQWLTGWLDSDSNSTVTQTDLCLKCHQRDLCESFALVAHNVAPSELESLTRKALGQNTGPATDSESGRQTRRVDAQPAAWNADAIPAFAKNGTPNTPQTLACATCHREHHGQMIDMKAMTDQQCQSCHARDFHSFETDHPEFSQWPFLAERTIQFDHASHHFKHFPQGNRPFECAQCHREDAQGNVQQLVPFEQACAECHAGPLTLSAQQGLTLLQLPSLDTQLLEQNGMGVGSWPADLSYDFDGRLSPWMHLLLTADPEAANGLAALGTDFDFLDLEPTQEEQLQAARSVAWGIKRLVADLAARGPEAVRQRLQIVWQVPLSNAQLSRLTQNASLTVFRDTARLWFPELQAEVESQVVSPMSSIAVTETWPLEDDSQGLPQSPSEFNWASARSSGDSRSFALADPILGRLLQPRSKANPIQEPQEILVDNPLTGKYAPPPVRLPVPEPLPPVASAAPPRSERTGRPADPPSPATRDQAGPAAPRGLEIPGPGTPSRPDEQRSVTDSLPVPIAPTVDPSSPDLLATNPLVGRRAVVSIDERFVRQAMVADQPSANTVPPVNSPETTGRPELPANSPAPVVSSQNSNPPENQVSSPEIDDPTLLAANPLAIRGGRSTLGAAPQPPSTPQGTTGAPVAGLSGGGANEAVEGPPWEPPVPGSDPPRDNDLVANQGVENSRLDSLTDAEPLDRQSPPSEPTSQARDSTPPSTTQSVYSPVGWVRDDSTYSLKYHIQGHADPWLQAWIEWVVTMEPPVEQDALRRSMLDAIAAPHNPGNCMQCHQTQSVTHESRTILGATSSMSTPSTRQASLTSSASTTPTWIQWRAQQRDPSLKGWTKFNHRPHTLLPSLSDCRSCHQLVEPTTPAQSGPGSHGELPLAGGKDPGVLSQSQLAVQPVGFASMMARQDGGGRSGLTTARVFSGQHSMDSSNSLAPNSEHEGGFKRSDFHTIQKAECASCHRAGNTSNRCTTCHNYHIGQRVQD